MRIRKQCHWCERFVYDFYERENFNPINGQRFMIAECENCVERCCHPCGCTEVAAQTGERKSFCRVHELECWRGILADAIEAGDAEEIAYAREEISKLDGRMELAVAA